MTLKEKFILKNVKQLHAIVNLTGQSSLELGSCLQLNYFRSHVVEPAQRFEQMPLCLKYKRKMGHKSPFLSFSIPPHSLHTWIISLSIKKRKLPREQMHALVFNLIISGSILHVLCNLYSSLQGSNSLVKAVAYALLKLVRVWYVNDPF